MDRTRLRRGTFGERGGTVPETLRCSWGRTRSELAHMAAKDVRLLRISRSFTGHSHRCCVSLWVEQIVHRRVSQVMRYNFSAGVSGVIQSSSANRSRDPAHPNLSVCDFARKAMSHIPETHHDRSQTSPQLLRQSQTPHHRDPSHLPRPQPP